MGAHPSISPLNRSLFHSFQRVVLFLALLGLGSSLGCQVVGDGLAGFLPDTPAKTDLDQLAGKESNGIYVIEIANGSREPERETVPLVEGMTVNQALAKAGITKRRGNWEIELIRTNPQTGQRHKMSVNYESKDREVPVEQDYALYPNDHLIVRQAPAKTLGDLFGGMTGSP